jgi:drug/metabolite transporter (DMT)-like permease
VVAVCCGAGLPHYLLSSLGGARTSAVLVGIVVPGTAPLFVAVIAALLWRARISAVQVGALLLVVAGVAVSIGSVTDARQAGGIAALVAAGFSWAVYTSALRCCTFAPLEVVLVVALSNAAVDAVAVVSGLAPSSIRAGSAAAGDVVLFVLLQGIGVGVLAVLCYATAVRHLGGPVAATSGATSPVLTLLLAVPLFGEPVTAGTVLVLVLVLAGVATYNLAQVRRARAVPAPRPTPDPPASQTVAVPSPRELTEGEPAC